MSDFDDLCSRAGFTAQTHGHQLDEFRRLGHEDSLAKAVCKNCGAEAGIDTVSGTKYGKALNDRCPGPIAEPIGTEGEG